MSDRVFDVLVVVSDGATRDNLCSLFARDGYRVRTVATIEEAVERTDWSNVLALVVDRRHFASANQELLARLTAEAPESAVVVVTEGADSQGIMAALHSGADDCLPTPVDADTLRATLARMLRRRRLVTEIRQSEARLASILDTAVDAIITIDERGIVQSVNAAAVRLFGFAEREIVGQNVKLLMPSPDCDQHDTYIQNYLRTGEKKIIGIGREVVGLRKDGSLFAMDLAVSEVRLDDRRLFTGIVRDLSQQKQAEERSRQAERLAAIGQTVTGLAHESRNAFQRSQACLEMLAMELEDRPEALELVERTQKALDDLHHLYEEVRDYAAPIILDRQVCDLAHVWRDSWSHLRQAHGEKGVHLIERADGVDLACQVDWFAMGQVFRNVLENAIAACPVGGRIVVHCREVRLLGQYAIEVAIRDDGPGFDPANRGKVFDPFFTTKVKGTGLGMAIARRIVEAHGGRIALGDAGPGAEVILTLPRA
jgi:hypothetical protein